jgi:hypothetical protein
MTILKEKRNMKDIIGEGNRETRKTSKQTRHTQVYKQQKFNTTPKEKQNMYPIYHEVIRKFFSVFLVVSMALTQALPSGLAQVDPAQEERLREALQPGTEVTGEPQPAEAADEDWTPTTTEFLTGDNPLQPVGPNPPETGTIGQGDVPEAQTAKDPSAPKEGALLEEYLASYGEVEVTEVTADSVGGYTYTLDGNGEPVTTSIFDITLSNSLPDTMIIQEVNFDSEENPFGETVVISFANAVLDPETWAVVDGKIEIAVLRADGSQNNQTSVTYLNGQPAAITLTEYDEFGVGVVRHVEMFVSGLVADENGNAIDWIVNGTIHSDDSDSGILLETFQLVFQDGRASVLYRTIYAEDGTILDEIATTDEAEIDAVLQSYRQVYAYGQLKPKKLQEAWHARREIGRALAKAFATVDSLNAEDYLTLDGAMRLRSVQEEFKSAIETLPEGDRAEWIKKFNEYLIASDRIISAKPLLVKLADNREVIVRNSPDVMAQIIRRFKMMDPNGEVTLDRLAGIDPEDLAGLETVKEYFSARQIGTSFDLPSFDLFSPLGHLELVERLVRKFPVMIIEGPVQVLDVPAFLRHVDGTAQVYEAAKAAIEKVFTENPYAFDANPLTVQDILKGISDLKELNLALVNAVLPVLEAYRGEAVFKGLVTGEITGILNQYQSPYMQAWELLNQGLNGRPAEFEINGITVAVSRQELSDFINHLPQDTYDLYRYPGVKANVDPAFMTGLISAGYFNSLSNVNLAFQYAGQLPAEPADPRLRHYQIAYASQYQVLEEMLRTWAGEVVRPDGTVDFDKLRFRMLISYDLEMALGRAEEYLANQSQKMLDFSNRKFELENCAAIYDEMKALLAETQKELRARFNPLLQDVIYDTFNEVTIRVSQRYQNLVNSFNQVLENVVVTIQTPQTPGTFRPAQINSEVLEKILDAVSIRTNGYLGFSRAVYQRMSGITPEMLQDLLSPNQVTALTRFDFNEWGYGQDAYLAPQEVLFKLIPQLVQKFGTSDTETLIQKLTENLPFPVEIGQSLEVTVRNIIADFCQRTGAAIDSSSINNIQDLLALRDLMVSQSQALRNALRVYTANLSGEEISSIESWANDNGYWNGSYQENWNYVVSRFQAKVWEPVWLEVRGVRVPIRQILNIEKFPYSPVYDEKLFTGIAAGDFTDAEQGGDVNRYAYIRLSDEMIDYMMSPELSALGRMQLVVNMVDRLMSMEPAPAITFDKDGVTELDPEAFRLYLKGVRAMQQAIYDEARLRTDALIEKFKALEKGSYTIDEINAMHAELLVLRQGLIEYLEKMAGQHERRDVIETEDEVSLIFQDAFEAFVAMVGKADLVIDIQGVSVAIPAKTITAALVDYVRANITANPAAHDFAKLFGIDVDMVRSAHKLENYLGEQMVVLPRNSEYVQIISQLSELGYMQLAAALVKKYAAEVVADGQVDVAKLIDLITNKDSAVAYAKKSAEAFVAGKAAEIEALNGRSVTLKDFSTLANILSDIRVGLVSSMNDFLSGNADEALQRELEDFITGLYENARKLWTNRTFGYEVNGQKIQIQLTEEVMGRFVETIRQYLLAHPADMPAFPVDEMPLVPVLYKTDMVLAEEPMLASDFDRIMPIRPIIWPIDPIWIPVPRPGSYNPAYHPTELAMTELFCRLAVKYGDFVLTPDENGVLQFDGDKFLAELLLPDSDRANRRLDQILAQDLPALRDYLESLKDENGAISVSALRAINLSFSEVKSRIEKLYQDSSVKATEVWAAFMQLYEGTLLSENTLLSFDYRGSKITFEAAVLDKLLMSLYKEGKLDPDLTARFDALIRAGETTKQYSSFKWLQGLIQYDIVGGKIYSIGDLAGKEGAGGLAYAVDEMITFGALATIPGINRRDLSDLEAAEMAGALKLTPVDPMTLMGLLDMRSLAPGSGVSGGGLMTVSQMASADSIMAERSFVDVKVDLDVLRCYKFGNCGVIDERPILYKLGGLPFTSARFRSFEFLPEVIKALTDIMGEDFMLTEGRVNLDHLRAGLEQFPANEVETLALYHGVSVESLRAYRTDPGYCQMSIPGKCTERVLYSYQDGEGLRHYKTADFAFWAWLQGDQVPHYAWQGKKILQVQDASVEDAFLAEGYHSLFSEQYPFENIQVTVTPWGDVTASEVQNFDLEYSVETCPKGAEDCMAKTLVVQVTGVRRLVNGEWKYEIPETDLSEKYREAVLKHLVDVTGLTLEALKEAIQEVVITSEIVKNEAGAFKVYHFDVTFKEGSKMGEVRLIDVLGDGFLPSTVRFDSQPVAGYDGGLLIAAARMEWQSTGLKAAVSYGPAGEIREIDWSRTVWMHTPCNEFGACPQSMYPVETFLCQDKYDYVTGKITITRSPGFAVKTYELADELAWAKLTDHQWIMTLENSMDNQYHIMELQEFTNGGMTPVIRTFFQYEVLQTALVCPAENPGCNTRQAVLAGMQRVATNGAYLSMSAIQGSEARVDVYDGEEHVLQFANLKNLLEQVGELENKYNPVVRAYLATVRELNSNFGIPEKQLTVWLDAKWVQISVLKTYFGVFSYVEFDASIRSSAYNRSRLNLLGTLTLPNQTEFAFDLNGNLQDGHLRYEDGAVSGIQEVTMKYDEQGRLENVQLYDGPTAVCHGPGCAAPGRVVKEINYRYWPSCRGEMCTMGFFSDSAEVIYPLSDKITRRIVTFNSGGFMTITIPAGDIVSVQEFGKDADGNEVLLVNNEFQYSPLRLLGEEELASCVAGEKGGCVRPWPVPSVLESIRRTDANGNLLSTVVMGMRLPPDIFGGPHPLPDPNRPPLEVPAELDANFDGVERIFLGHPATVTLADGREVQIFYKDFEDLFAQVLRLEQSPNPELLRQAVLAHLGETFGLSAEELSALIESLEIDLDKPAVTVQFLAGRMANGRLIDVLGEGSMPRSAVVSFATPDAQGKTAIQAAQLLFAGKDALVAYEAGKIVSVEWSGPDPRCGVLYECFWEGRVFLYQDVYAYNGEGAITISRGTLMISKPVPYDEIGKAEYFDFGTVTANFNTVLKLQQFPDGKYHPVSMEEYPANKMAWYEYPQVTTQFEYQVMQPTCDVDVPNCPGAMVILSGIVRKTGDQVLSVTSINAMGHKALVNVDGAEHNLEFASLENLIAQIREIEKEYLLVQKVRKTVINDLATTYGIGVEKVLAWIESGDLTLEVGPVAAKVITVKAVFAPRIQKGRYDVREVDPLGMFVIPAEMTFEVGQSTPYFPWYILRDQAIQKDDGGIALAELDSALPEVPSDEPIFRKWPVERFLPVSYSVRAVHVKYDGGEFGSVFDPSLGNPEVPQMRPDNYYLDVGYDGRGQFLTAVLYQKPGACEDFAGGECPIPNKILKQIEVHRVESFCDVNGGMMVCTMVMPSLSVVVRYPQSQDIVRRDVDYNLWEQGPSLGTIQSVSEYVKDSGGNDVLTVKNTFRYENSEITDGNNAAKILIGISRVDAEGRPLSEIKIAGRTAEVILANGMAAKTEFRISEELLDFVRAFEKENEGVVYRMVFADGRALVVDNSKTGKKALKIQALKDGQYEDVQALDFLSYEVQPFEDGRTILRFVFSPESDGEFQVRQSENEPLMFSIREYRDGETLEPFGSLTKHSRYQILTFGNQPTFVKTFEHLHAYNPADGGGRSVSHRYWDYDGEGHLQGERLYRFANAGGDYVLELNTAYGADGAVSYHASVKQFWPLPEPKVYFDGDLREVAFSEASSDWYQILLSLKGKTTEGEDIEIVIHQDRIEVNIGKSYVFGAAMVVVERTGEGGAETYTTSVKAGDLDLVVPPFVSAEQPVYDGARGKLVLTTTDGKTVTLNTRSLTYLVSENVLETEVYENVQLVKESTYKLIGGKFELISETMRRPDSNVVLQNRKWLFSGAGLPMMETVQRRSDNGDYVTMTRSYSRRGWGRYSFAARSGTKRVNGIVTSPNAIFQTGDSGLMKAIEAEVRMVGKPSAQGLVAFDFSGGARMVDSCPSNWNTTSCIKLF